MKIFDVQEIDYNLKQYGKCKYTGKVANFVLGDKPHGKGVAVFADGTTFDGYWLNGDMTEGKMFTPKGTTFSGAFEKSVWKKGRIDFSNGDFIEGYIDDGELIYQKVEQHYENGYLKANNIVYNKDENVVVFEGEFVQTLTTNDGKVWDLKQNGLFEMFNYTNRINYNFLPGNSKCHLQYGNMSVRATTGECFEGKKVTKKYLQQKSQKLGFSVCSIPADQICMFCEFDVNGNIINDNNEQYHGTYTNPNGEKFQGYFFQSKTILPLRFYKGKLSIQLFEGEFNGELSTNVLLSDNKKLFNCYSGTLIDKKSNIVYDGIFLYQGHNLNVCEGCLFDNGLQFIEGTITKKSVNENFKFRVKYNNFKDLKFNDDENQKYLLANNVYGEVEKNGSIKKGTFNLTLKRGSKIFYEFKKGKLNIDLGNGKRFDGITCDNFSKEATGYCAKKSVKMCSKIAYFGELVWQDEKGNIRQNGLFDSDFNFIEGKYKAKVLLKKYNYEKLIDVDICLDEKNNFEQYAFGIVDTKINADNEDKITVQEQGKFNMNLELQEGEIVKNSADIRCMLKTKNGLIYTGQEIKILSDCICYYSGQFSRNDKAELGCFEFLKGDCRFEFEKVKYDAIFDKQGLRAFDGKKYAGMITCQNLDERKKFLYTTNNFNSVLNVYKNHEMQIDR